MLAEGQRITVIANEVLWVVALIIGAVGKRARLVDLLTVVSANGKDESIRLELEEALGRFANGTEQDLEVSTAGTITIESEVTILIENVGVQVAAAVGGVATANLRRLFGIFRQGGRLGKEQRSTEGIEDAALALRFAGKSVTPEARLTLALTSVESKTSVFIFTATEVVISRLRGVALILATTVVQGARVSARLTITLGVPEASSASANGSGRGVGTNRVGTTRLILAEVDGDATGEVGITSEDDGGWSLFSDGSGRASTGTLGSERTIGTDTVSTSGGVGDTSIGGTLVNGVVVGLGRDTSRELGGTNKETITSETSVTNTQTLVEASTELGINSSSEY